MTKRKTLTYCTHTHTRMHLNHTHTQPSPQSRCASLPVQWWFSMAVESHTGAKPVGLSSILHRVSSSVRPSPLSLSVHACLFLGLSHTHSSVLARCCTHTPAHTKARASEWARGWARTRETRGGGDKGIKKENLGWLREWLKLPCSSVLNLCCSSGHTHTHTHTLG